ncbi:MAG TPA: DUF2460 domain-containing protein [Terriglobia bacterium]|nr:DUF2460 domain-containing protein [Terriglobia bacterium]HZP34184.1 DUF2460 domain-containing protein [Candidatus Acidoferrales bacterium]
MSNIVFSPPPYLAWSVFKSPQFNTVVQSATSGKTVRVALWSNPIWTFKLTWDVIRDGNATPSDIQTLIDFFLARQGSFDTFLFTDPTDNSVSNQQFGTGDGTTLSFQLTRTWASFAEAIQNTNGAPVIKKNGVTLSAGVDYSINSTGLVTFSVAPATSAVLTWTGSFFYRLRFKNDLQEFENFLFNLWSAKTVELVSERL